MLRKTDELPGVQVFRARCFPDDRGFLLQSFVSSELRKRGIMGDFPQAIQSKSRRGVVRGLHFQWDPPQGKLVRCVCGAIFDVVMDIRRGSPTFGDHVAVEMTGENHQVLWVPPGFAHGFMAMEDDTVVLYMCTSEWNPAGEGGILWNDPAVGIGWPALSPVVSAKDGQNPALAEWLRDTRSQHFTIK